MACGCGKRTMPVGYTSANIPSSAPPRPDTAEAAALAAVAAADAISAAEAIVAVAPDVHSARDAVTTREVPVRE